jgi:hypothetical protein
MRLFRRNRTIYGCGNCGETFKTQEALAAHRDPVCPIVAIERQMASWNKRVLQRVADQQAVAKEFEV